MSIVGAVFVTEQELAEDRQAEQELARATARIKAKATDLWNRSTELTQTIRELKARMVAAGDPVTRELSNAHDAALDELEAIREDQYEMVSEALYGRYSPATIGAWCRRAMEMGATHPRFDAKLLDDLIHLRKVPNAPFRERLAQIVAFEEDNHRAGEGGEGHENYWDHPITQEVALAMDCDPRQAGRRLGRYLSAASGTTGGHKVKSLALFIDYDVSSRLARTLGMRPYEAGI